MATPYLQNIHEEVVSTQDLAREGLKDLPKVIIASSQTGGRGRTGSKWVNADRALAASVAWRSGTNDGRPFSLMAGLAATRALSRDVTLKWPNDVMLGDLKVGGILIEKSRGVVVAGLGVNLYWPQPPEGMGAVLSDDPGPLLFMEVGALWAAELLGLVDATGWPADGYREVCQTLGREITWDPNGSGSAIGITESGALLVETPSGIREVFAGGIRHLRSAQLDDRRLRERGPEEGD